MSLLVVLVAAGAAQATPTAPIFGGPALIDRAAPFPALPGTELTDISCGTPTSCVAVGGRVAQYTTDAGGPGAPTWSPAHAITPNAINAVSCPTSSLCVAAASDGTVLRSTDGGVSWAAPVAVAAGSFTTVSCTDTGLCVAAGSGVYVSSDGGQTWAGPGDLPPNVPFEKVSCLASGVCAAIETATANVFVSNAIGDGEPPVWTETHTSVGGFLTDLSCTPNGICVAPSTFGDVAVSTDLNSAGTSWSTSVADGTGDPATGRVGLVSMSCVESSTVATTDQCVAGDSLGSTAISTDVGGSGQPSWSIVATFDTGLIEANDSPGNSGTNVYPLYPIACVGGGWCIAADKIGNVTYATVPAANPAATSWSAPPTAIDGVDQMSGVSCASNGLLCAAWDTTGHVVTSTDGGEHWAPPVALANSIAGVSCVNGGECVAVGMSADPSNREISGRVLTATPTATAATWTDAEFDVTATNGGIPLGPTVRGVSCMESGACLAVDDAGQSLISPDLGADWYVVPTGDAAPLTAVSCAGGAFCAAIDAAGSVVTSTDVASGDPSWSSPVLIDGTAASPGKLTGLSCTARGLCAAVDGSGHVMITTNSGLVWSKPASVNGSSTLALVSVSCTSSELCIVVDARGSAFYSTNPSAGSPTWTVASSNTSDLTAVGCVGTGLCLGVDAVGDAIVGTSQVPKVTLSGASGQFADTISRTSSADQRLTVTNSGNAPLNVASATLAGTDAGQFGLSGDSCSGAFIPPGASCSVSVNFDPSSTGSFSGAELAIASDAGSSPDGLALSGTAVLGPLVSLSGGPAVFPQTATGAASPTHTVTATNSGGSPLHIAVAALTGPDAGQFRLTAAGGCAGAVLAPGASCSVVVQFAPARAGTASAALEFDSDGDPNQSEVALSGTAVAAAVASNQFSFVEVKAGKRGTITAEVRLPRAGRFALSTSSTLPAVKAKPTNARSGKAKAPKAKRITYSPHVAAAIKGPTTATIKITPTRAAAAALKAHRKLRVVITATFAPPGLARHTETSAVTVRRG